MSSRTVGAVCASAIAPSIRSSKRLWPFTAFARHDDVLEIAACADQLLEPRIERVRHHQHAGAAVGQHEAVVVLGHQRVDRHGDDAGLEAAEEGGGPVDGVEQRDQHPLLAAHAERAQARGEARDAVGELAVGPGAARIDEGRLVGTAGLEIAVEDVGGEIVVARDRAHRSGRRHIRARLGRNSHSHSPAEYRTNCDALCRRRQQPQYRDPPASHWSLTP